MRYLALDIGGLLTPVYGGSDGVAGGMFSGISDGVGKRHDKPKPIFFLVLAIYKGDATSPSASDVIPHFFKQTRDRIQPL